MSEFNKRFLTGTEHTGRFMVYSLKTKRKYYVETIDEYNRAKNWGDVDPVTKKLTGSYGEKYKGSIDESESLITEENGFKDIKVIHSGSPFSYIDELDKKYENGTEGIA